MGKQSFLPVTENGYNVIIADEYISALQEEYSKTREWGMTLAQKLEEQNAVIESLREENRRLAQQNTAIFDESKSIARQLGAPEGSDGEFTPEMLKKLISDIISSADQIRNEANIYAEKTIKNAQKTAESIESECKKSVRELSDLLEKMHKDMELYSGNN